MLFQTPRLHVRKIRPGDYDVMLRVYSDPVGARWVGDGKPLSAEDCGRWVEVTLHNYSTRGYGMSAIQAPGKGPSGTPEIVGFCGLVHPGGQETAELKYAIASEHQGVGYATEAAMGMLRYGLDVHGIREVIATTAPENLASHRVLVKCGMEDAGLLVDADGDEIRLFRWKAPTA